MRPSGLAGPVMQEWNHLFKSDWPLKRERLLNTKICGPDVFLFKEKPLY